MAQKHVVILEDDLDGGQATDTVRFSIDGVSYDIDLNDGNAKRLRSAFEPYVNAGRRVGGRRSTGSGKKTAGRNATGLDLNEVRAWARQEGYEVSDRGRVSAVVLDAYKTAH